MKACCPPCNSRDSMETRQTSRSSHMTQESHSMLHLCAAAARRIQSLSGTSSGLASARTWCALLSASPPATFCCVSGVRELWLAFLAEQLRSFSACILTDRPCGEVPVVTETGSYCCLLVSHADLWMLQCICRTSYSKKSSNTYHLISF